MTIEKFLEFIRSGQEITVDSDIHKFMGIMSSEDMKITCCLNNSYHTPEEIRAAFFQADRKGRGRNIQLVSTIYNGFRQKYYCGKERVYQFGLPFSGSRRNYH